MADIDVAATPDALQKLIERGKKVKEVLDKLRKSADQFATTLYKGLDKTDIGISDADVGRIKTAMDNLGGSIGATSAELEMMAVKFGTLIAMGVDKELFKMSGGFFSMADGAKEMSAQMDEFIRRASGSKIVSKIFGETGAKAINFMANIAAAGDAGRNMENALLKQAAAAGGLSKMMKSLNNNYEMTGTKVLKFAKDAELVGNATGLYSERVAKLQHELMAIPGSMDKMITFTKQLYPALIAEESVIKVTQGTLLELAEVTNYMKDVQKDFTTGTKGALEALSKMHLASQKTEIPMGIMKKYAQDVAAQFLYLGDNTQGAIDVMASFGPALAESGYGPRAIADIVKGFTKGISDMDIAQQAFLSGMTGGVGGLQGAFEIDIMLAEG